VSDVKREIWRLTLPSQIIRLEYLFQAGVIIPGCKTMARMLSSSFVVVNFQNPTSRKRCIIELKGAAN